VAILLALPTPFILLKTNEDLKIIYHASKIAPVLFYYFYLLSKVHLRKRRWSYYLTMSTSFIILMWLIFSALFVVYYERLPKTFNFLNTCIAESYGNKGEEFHIKGEVDAAFSKYLKSLKYYPLVRVHRNIGAIYANNKGNAEKALYHFEEYLRLQPRADDRDAIMNYCNQVKARMK
jgi:tetratricopeptide (TPR) repeat protein